MNGRGGLPDAGQGTCCWGAAVNGADGCTCWEPVHDRPQSPPDAGPAGVRDGMCGDCAYRPGSPERRRDPVAAHDVDDLDTLAAAGVPFWCHDGMRAVVAQRHPSGAVVPATTSGDGTTVQWDPPIVAGVPFRADGSPGLLCAGWAARGRAMNARRGRDG